MALVDLGQPTTWPASFRSIVQRVALEAADWPEASESTASDLLHHDWELTETIETQARTALADELVAAYHASRFLPAEVDDIRLAGLRLASGDLLERKLRIAAAECPDLLDDAAVAHVIAASPMVKDNRARRRGLLNVVVPYADLASDNARGLGNFVDMWGGEIISYTGDAFTEAVVRQLTTFSVPTIVEVGVRVDEIPRGLRHVWPTAVGTLLKLENVGATWALEVPLAGERVVALIHPDDPRWPEALDDVRWSH